jgi:TetR/AcrR family transcriptional regulator, mexJK operon transcriptional repressor
MATRKKHAAETPPIPPFLRGDDKRSVILRAAHRLFLRDGYAVTSMDAITLEAGVSKATVYAHFDGKQKLFEELVRGGSEEAIRSIPPLVRQGRDPASELLAFFEPFLGIVFHGGYAWSRMVIAEAARHPENAVLFYRCTIERITGTVESYLGSLRDEGLFSTRNVRLAAETLVAVVLLGPLHRVLILGPGAVDDRTSLRAGIDLILGTSTS